MYLTCVNALHGTVDGLEWLPLYPGDHLPRCPATPVVVCSHVGLPGNCRGDRGCRGWVGFGQTPAPAINAPPLPDLLVVRACVAPVQLSSVS